MPASSVTCESCDDLIAFLSDYCSGCYLSFDAEGVFALSCWDGM